MNEIPFSITLRGVVKVGVDKITLNIYNSTTTIDLGLSYKSDARSFLEKGQNLFDIVLNTAQEFVTSQGNDTRFSAADLYHLALEKYPYLKRNSWTSHMIASSSNHRSQKHYGVKRDFFFYEGNGAYKLNPKYVKAKLESER